MPEALATLACGKAPLRFDRVECGAAWRTHVARAAALLRRAPDQPVALYHPDPYDFSAWLFAAWHAGRRVHLPADPGDATEQARAGALVLGAIAGSAHPQLPDAGEMGALAALPLRCEVLRVFTSGSTGAPQAIDKRLDQLQAEIAMLDRAFGARLGADTPFASTVSHQHMYGLPFALLWPLACGRPLRRAAVRTPAELPALEPRSVLIASPAFLRRLGDTCAALHSVFCAGGLLPAEAARGVATQLGAQLVEIYGSSETGAVASRGAVDDAWRELPGVSFALDGDSLLQVRSPLLRDEGWFASADRAEPVGNGFRLLGRSDRIAKVEDKRISLDAIEQVLLGHDAIAEARATVLREQRDTLAVALVMSDAGRRRYRESGRNELIAALRETLRPRIDAVALPRRWRFVAALPTDALGKLRQAALERLFHERPLLPLVLDHAATPDTATLSLEIAPDLAVFEGHFPQAPIVPGVALLHWVMHHAQAQFAPPGQFLGLRALKFHRVVRPHTLLQLSLTWLRERGAVEFTYDSPAGRHASGRVLVGAAAT